LLAQRYRCLPSWLRHGAAPLASLIPESTKGLHGLRRAREFLAGANLPDAEMYAGWVEILHAGGAPAAARRRMAADQPDRRALPSGASQQPLDAMQQTDLCSFLPAIFSPMAMR